MPSLSFEKSKGVKPVAVVKGGSMDGEVLYLGEGANTSKKGRREINASRYATELRELKAPEKIQLINRLQEAKDKGLTPDQLISESALAKKLYERILNDDLNDKSIQLPDDAMFQVLPSPDPKTRQIFYAGGVSGSGKSYMAKGLAEYYRKFFPDREVYLISKLTEDETLDSMKPPPKRINIQTLIDDYPSIEEFEDCMVIFDDYDTFTGDADKVVHKLIDDLAIMG